MDDLLRLLDRQYERAESATGTRFVRELLAYHALITSTDPLAAELADMRAAAEGAVERFAEVDRQLTAETKVLRDELLSRAPEADDSSLPRPNHVQASGDELLRWRFSLANFERIPAQGGLAENVASGLTVAACAGMLVAILRVKVDALQHGAPPERVENNRRPDLDDLVRELARLQARWEHAMTDLRQDAARLGGLALVPIEHVLREGSPVPPEGSSEEDLARWVDQNFRRVWSGTSVVPRALSAPLGAPDPHDEEWAEALAGQLRGHLQTVHEDLRRRVASSSMEPSRTEANHGPLRLGRAEELRTYGGVLGGALVGVTSFTAVGLGSNWWAATAVLGSVLLIVALGLILQRNAQASTSPAHERRSVPIITAWWFIATNALVGVLLIVVGAMGATTSVGNGPARLSVTAGHFFGPYGEENRVGTIRLEQFVVRHDGERVRLDLELDLHASGAAAIPAGQTVSGIGIRSMRPPQLALYLGNVPGRNCAADPRLGRSCVGLDLTVAGNPADYVFVYAHGWWKLAGWFQVSTLGASMEGGKVRLRALPAAP